MKNNKKAFTLIEVFIVIVIVSTLVAIVIPGFIASKRQAETLKNRLGPKTIVVNDGGKEKTVEINTIKKLGSNIYFLPSDYDSDYHLNANKIEIDKINLALIDFLKGDDFKIKNIEYINGGVYIVVE